MGKGITETLYWFYNLVLFYACATGRFYAFTMLLYADCQFCFIPLYISTHLRFYGSLCFYTTVLFYASRMLLYADCQFCFIPLFYGSLCFYTTVLFYTSTMLLYADCQSCFTPLYVSTHLRFYDSLYIVTAY